METIRLSVHEREETGNGPARRLRAKGLIPGTSYGKGKTPTNISLDLEELKAVWVHGHNVVLELDFGKPAKGAKTAAKGKAKETRYAVIKELQFHPTKRHVLHVDLHEVDLAVEIEAEVALEPVGTPAGVVDGGIVEWERHAVTVRALPSDVPAVLEIDVSKLEIGHHLPVSAIKAPKGVVIVDDPETVVVALLPPRVEHAAGETAEGVEPEVIGSQKSEE